MLFRMSKNVNHKEKFISHLPSGKVQYFELFSKIVIITKRINHLLL